jgi:hypothetical protein
MFTSTHRWLSDPSLDIVPGDAITGGVDFARYFRNRTYVLQSKAVFSQASGSRQAIRDLQTNAVHYYQRPDAAHLGVDESATTLAGHGGLIHFGRTEKSKWRFSDTLRWKSPGLELNDLGYLRQADSVSNEAQVGYYRSEPQGMFRAFNVSLFRSDAWDFGGLKTEGSTGASASGVFQNKWHAFVSLIRAERNVATRLLRGGPAFALDRFLSLSARGSTDPSRRASLFCGIHQHTFAEGRSSLRQFSPGVSLRFSDSFSVASELEYEGNVNDLEYVATPQASGRTLYLLGRIRQKTLGAVFRVNLSLTPDLSIQYYGSPFLSAGRYSDFKRTTAPLAKRYAERFYPLAPGEITYRPEANVYDVSEAGAAYSFERPDFSFRQFRSNLVLRWEPKPGSSLYVVWAQKRTDESIAWEGSLGQNYSALWNAPSQNVLLVKFSYYLPLN